jgi:PAS domain S-box-containing protein
LRGQLREGNAERAFVAAALEDAMRRLREQERALSARAEQSERLNSEIVASLASGLLVVGLRGEVRTLNPAARRMLNRSAVATGVGFRELLTDAAPLGDVVEQCLSTAQPILRRSIALRRRDGRDVHLGVTVSPLLDDQGGLQGAVCLFSDLTAVVELEEQLRLKDSLARLGELTAGLAHEFRNGLATVHGYARLIDPAQVPAPYASYVRRHEPMPRRARLMALLLMWTSVSISLAWLAHTGWLSPRSGAAIVGAALAGSVAVVLVGRARTGARQT